VITYHLSPLERWSATPAEGPYTAPSLADEGFIHCTTGVDEMVATADRYYREVPGPFVILSVELDAVGDSWRYDGPDERYPHIYGPIPRAAVVRVAPIPRQADGRFLSFPP
jgi:uncharacterized protein (DUF952 family)